MRNTMQIGVELTNFHEFAGILRALPAAVESRVMADALKVACKPMLQIAKAKVPVRTGALRRSLTVIVKRYPKSGKVLALIGPSRSYYAGGKKLKKNASRRGADKPANYAHLVEYGHRTRLGKSRSGKFRKWSAKERRAAFEGGSSLPSAGKKLVGTVPARPFLRPAAKQGGPLVVRDLAKGVRIGHQRELKRLAAKMKRIATAA